MRNVYQDVNAVLEDFWQHRERSLATSGPGAQARSGTHMSSAQKFVASLFRKAGLKPEEIHLDDPCLPGYFRRAKQWDIVAKHEDLLVGAVELKSQIGSLGNNSNNRIEEAIGSAFDLQMLQQRTGRFGAIQPGKPMS